MPRLSISKPSFSHEQMLLRDGEPKPTNLPSRSKTSSLKI